MGSGFAGFMASRMRWHMNHPVRYEPSPSIRCSCSALTLFLLAAMIRVASNHLCKRPDHPAAAGSRGLHLGWVWFCDRRAARTLFHIFLAEFFRIQLREACLLRLADSA